VIIKSHIRGGYRAAATYLKEEGANEQVRLVHISDPDAGNVDDAFRNMWLIGRSTRATKPLHHVSINPRKEERLTDAQVLRICACLEEKYGYAAGEHQRVIVEHVKDGRQHFHVMWHRVSFGNGQLVWPGHHWKKSKQAAREMERELGLKGPSPGRHGRGEGTRPRPRSRARCVAPLPRRTTRLPASRLCTSPARSAGARTTMGRAFRAAQRALLVPGRRPSRSSIARSLTRILTSGASSRGLDRTYREGHALPTPAFPRREASIDELIAWAWENRRADILAQFGIYVTFDL